MMTDCTECRKHLDDCDCPASIRLTQMPRTPRALNDVETAAKLLATAIRTTGATRDAAFNAAWPLLVPTARRFCRKLDLDTDTEDAIANAGMKMWQTVLRWNTTESGEIGPGAVTNVIWQATYNTLTPRARYRDNLAPISVDTIDPATWDHEQEAAEADIHRDVERIARQAAMIRPLWGRILRTLMACDGSLERVATYLGQPSGTIRRNLKEMRDSGILDELRGDPSTIATQMDLFAA